MFSMFLVVFYYCSHVNKADYLVNVVTKVSVSVQKYA